VQSKSELILHSPSGNAEVHIDLINGGRLASFRIEGLEILKTKATHQTEAISWGAYPMAPWAGRIRKGLFYFEDRAYQLAINNPPHALHGTACFNKWTASSNSSCSIQLGKDDGWPFPGELIQEFELQDDYLSLHLKLKTKGDSFPATLGYHPWFLSSINSGQKATFDFRPIKMYKRDQEGIPDGELIKPTESPWDDCFVLEQDPKIVWPKLLELSLTANTKHWVVFNHTDEAFCVEPQTGPPDELNLNPQLVTEEKPLELDFKMTWRSLK
jgi:aldose 1-epimerase